MVIIQRIFRSSYRLLNNSLIKNNNINQLRCFSLTNINLADRFYTKKHEWITISGDIGTVGITQYAQEALGDVVYAQLPDVSALLNAENECGALESVKAASELYSPVSGTVIEKNTDVEDSPGLINSNCYDKGWLFKIKLTNRAELEKLMDDKKYEMYIKTEDH